ncbi:aminobenzoyl-glutamate transporter [Dulcicalothrix desertica PCC 7102]|uniref:Aminobenzoyl-glutamate transporter n=1 Tax=Dulcicalothrix desertica PCC 7102 TaxID=232991 RepID=A0A433VKU0_9CYAN|nr:AbgT family transporter [Dulcicalothrix desertica]RUT06748.1 aminobenzoyl-glutamate transporter [Dulcicalothrix desertica PCC 7102]TWH50144.1 aminobenzoyl-glutamate transport protein [Dulcicalothrix desertica PCC 7102]
MPETRDASAQAKSKWVEKSLAFIEGLGNKLPDPLTLFFILSLFIIVVSAIAASVNLSVVHPGTGKTVAAVSLLTPNSVRRIFTQAVKNFVEFPPLGTVLVAMLGVGVAEATGLLSALLREVVMITPRKLITPVVIFAGVLANVASDAGYVVLVPLGAVIFLAFGRHPLAGLAAAFAGVAGGFSANLLISSLDPLLAGLTQTAAQLIRPEYQVNATANYYFMAVSTFLITLIGWFICEKIVEPRLGAYTGDADIQMDEVTATERKALRWAGYAFLAFIAFILVLVIPSQGILRDPQKFTIIPSPFIDGIVFIIALAFFIPGVVYGKVAGTVRNNKDVARFLGNAMSSMGYYIALAFIAAQFISYFAWSNLGIIVAVKGADFLKATGITGPPLLILFILVSVAIDIFVGSASAKWAIMAPIFVPMFMLLGYSPELVQAAYRIGDSTTNIITPLMPYFPVVVAFGQRYDKSLGIGTLISLMLPYSIAFLIGWSVLFVIWFMFGLPLGPGAGMRI